MWEDEVESAPVHRELGAEVLLCHDRAFDVPAWPAAAPRRVPRRVFARLRRLPQREVARVVLERVRLLLLDLIRPLTGQLSVLAEARDAVVDVAVDRVGEAPRDQLLDHRDLAWDGLGGFRLGLRPAEPEVVCVLDVPARRPL